MSYFSLISLDMGLIFLLKHIGPSCVQISFPSFSPTSRKAYVELRVGESWRHTYSSCVAKSKTGSLGETSHKPWSRCASVWNFCGWYMNSFHEIFLSYLFGHGLTFFWNTLDLHVSIFLFFLFWIPSTFMCPEIFFNSPCLCNLERIAMNNMEFIFCGMKWNGMILHNFRCRIYEMHLSKCHNNLTKLKEITCFIL